MTDDPRQLLVLTVADGRVLTISAEAEAFVVDDTGRRLGEISGDFTPFLVSLDGAERLVLAGVLGGGDRTARVTVTFAHDTQTVLVARRPHAGVWMTFPTRFEPGSVVTVSGQDESGEQRWLVNSPPLSADRLEPVFGPAWTDYASL